MYLVGNNWANCLKTHNKLTMCLSGKTPSAPSVSKEAAQVRRVTRTYHIRVDLHGNHALHPRVIREGRLHLKGPS